MSLITLFFIDKGERYNNKIKDCSHEKGELIEDYNEKIQKGKKKGSGQKTNSQQNTEKNPNNRSIPRRVIQNHPIALQPNRPNEAMNAK